MLLSFIVSIWNIIYGTLTICDRIMTILYEDQRAVHNHEILDQHGTERYGLGVQRDV